MQLVFKLRILACQANVLANLIIKPFFKIIVFLQSSILFLLYFLSEGSNPNHHWWCRQKYSLYYPLFPDHSGYRVGSTPRNAPPPVRLRSARRGAAGAEGVTTCTTITTTTRTSPWRSCPTCSWATRPTARTVKDWPSTISKYQIIICLYSLTSVFILVS